MSDKGRNTFFQVAMSCLGLWLALSGFKASAAIGRPDATDQLNEKLRAEISKLYPGARIELVSSVGWSRGSLPAQVMAVSILGDSGRGEVGFLARGEAPGARADMEPELTESEGVVRFAAYLPTYVAVRRVMPGERLSKDLFVEQEVNVASGIAREYRGVILPWGTELAGLEARQTILEGQYPLSSGVQKTPDIRRGDVVRIRMVSGGVQLTTSGTASEPAYINGQVRVTASKTKHELTGRLTENGLVEVAL